MSAKKAARAKSKPKTKPKVKAKPEVTEKPKVKAGKPKYTRHVKCPQCGGIYFRITRSYRAKSPANPGMIELLPKYASYGWDGPPPDPTAGYGCIECPNCGAAIAPSGKFKTIRVRIDQDVDK